ncbi:MAG: hypothetical protein JXA82_16885 [Sedimentisphaerales bacterium]|nr:hypothetical protein [Sedimentisphaerales bacterium]
MSIDQHDDKTIYCRMLGHEVPFSYCRQGASGQPCRKIIDCWFQTIDIKTFMQTHFTEQQIQAILAPPKPKMTSLIELIQKARNHEKS